MLENHFKCKSKTNAYRGSQNRSRRHCVSNPRPHGTKTHGSTVAAVTVYVLVSHPVYIYIHALHVCVVVYLDEHRGVGGADDPELNVPQRVAMPADRIAHIPCGGGGGGEATLAVRLF